VKISSILGHYLNKKILLYLYQTRYFQIRTHPKLNFYFERISRLAQHLVKISYILEHYSKKFCFCCVFPYLVLILDISLLETLPNSIFFLRVDLVDCHNWYNFQAIWSVISHGISIEVWKIRIGLFWILLYKPHYVRFLDGFYLEMKLRKYFPFCKIS